jgi:hypothetical protein
MYFETWVKRIVANMADLTRVDHTREFPTPYHFLLYQLFATMGHWIQDSVDLDRSVESVKIEQIDMEHGSIAKSAVISFGRCLRSVLETSNLTPEFKVYILDMVLHRYKYAVKHDDLKQLYDLAMLNGGSRPEDLAGYHEALRRTLADVDRSELYMEPGEELYELIEERLS